MAAAITVFLGIVALLLKDYIQGRPKREDEKSREQESEFGESLANNDDARVSELLSERVDRLRREK